MPMRWSVPECHNTVETPHIKNHTATLVGKRLYVFGGYDGRRNHNDLYVLNVATLTWTKPQVYGKIPAGRNGHSATLVDRRIYILGGWLGSGPYAASDMHVLDLDLMKWSEPECEGPPPGPCNMHSADAIGRRVLVFRGGDGRDYLNDLHVLDVDTLTWTLADVTGERPPPRANHSSAVIGERLYIFGGWDGHKRLNDLYCLHAPSMVWSHVQPLGVPPSPRAGMSLSHVRGRLFLLSGSGPSAKCFNDLHIFDPELCSWVAPDVAPSPAGPDRRAGHSATVVDRRLFVFGGSFGATYFKDFHVLDTDPAPEVTLRQEPAPVLLRQQLGGYLNSPHFSDVTFIVEGRQIFAHKLVLSLLSQRFRAMFSSGMIESRERQLPVADVRYEVFWCLLEFLYTGEVRLPQDLPAAEPQDQEGCSEPAPSPPHAANENEGDGPLPLPRAADAALLPGGNNGGSVGAQTSLPLLLEVLEVADEFMLDHLKEVCEAELVGRLDFATAGVLREHAERANALQLAAYCDWWLRQQEFTADASPLS